MVAERGTPLKRNSSFPNEVNLEENEGERKREKEIRRDPASYKTEKRNADNMA